MLSPRLAKRDLRRPKEDLRTKCRQNNKDSQIPGAKHTSRNKKVKGKVSPALRATLRPVTFHNLLRSGRERILRDKPNNKACRLCRKKIRTILNRRRNKQAKCQSNTLTKAKTKILQSKKQKRERRAWPQVLFPVCVTLRTKSNATHTKRNSDRHATARPTFPRTRLNECQCAKRRPEFRGLSPCVTVNSLCHRTVHKLRARLSVTTHGRRSRCHLSLQFPHRTSTPTPTFLQCRSNKQCRTTRQEP